MICRACTASFSEQNQTCDACGAPRYVVDPFLEVTTGPADGYSVNLPRGEVVLGSSRRANITIDDRGVDALHARIIRDQTACWIEPVESAVVELDGRRIEGRERLAHGSIITIGAVGIVCYLTGENAS